jgi:hypothetical protein
VDATLQALVEATERGEEVPRVQVSLGNGLVSGQPIPHAEYSELQQQSIAVELKKDRGRTKLRAQKSAREEADQQSIGLAGFATTPANGSALALKEVTLALSTGEAVRARTMRIPVDQIELWWAGAYSVKKASGGGGFFVGGLIPLNFGS